MVYSYKESVLLCTAYFGIFDYFDYSVIGDTECFTINNGREFWKYVKNKKPDYANMRLLFAGMYIHWSCNKQVCKKQNDSKLIKCTCYFANDDVRGMFLAEKYNAGCITKDR